VRLESVCSIPVSDLLLTRVAFTPDAQYVAIGHRNQTLFEVLSGMPVRTFRFDAFAGHIAFSADGRYLGCVNLRDNHPNTRGLARVFEVETGRIVFEALTAHPVEAACFAEDSGGSLFVYNDRLAPANGSKFGSSVLAGVRLPRGEPVFRRELPGWDVRDIAFNGSSIVIFGQDTRGHAIRVEGATLQVRPFKVACFSYPDGAISEPTHLGIGGGLARLSPRGNLLAREVIDFEARKRYLSLVDLESGRKTTQPLPHDSLPTLAFSREGAHLISLADGDHGSVLRLWDCAGPALQAETHFDSRFHHLALDWDTRRIAAIGLGRCDIALIEP
jgi:hypothetical protein